EEELAQVDGKEVETSRVEMSRAPGRLREENQIEHQPEQPRHGSFDRYFPKFGRSDDRHKQPEPGQRAEHKVAGGDHQVESGPGNFAAAPERVFEDGVTEPEE